MNIGHHPIGPGHPVFIVAELSGNHNGLFGNAVNLVLAAFNAGANAVKTQCFTPDSITLDSDRPEFRLTWNGRERTLYDLYRETAIPMDWHPKLKALAESYGMEYFASVFSPQDADFMESLGVPAYKIASFELTDLPLIRYVSRKVKPVILSTGMATMREIGLAQEALTLGSDLSVDCILLKCTSAYPSLLQDSNLITIKDMQPDWGWWNVGLSDHTLSIAPPIVAVSLGACLIEKHLCLSRANGGPDSAFSLEPQEFAEMAKAVRGSEACLGEVRYGPTETELPMLRYRRSLWVVKDMVKGELFTTENVKSLRPDGGLPPDDLGTVLGRRAAKDIERGTPLAGSLAIVGLTHQNGLRQNPLRNRIERDDNKEREGKGQ